MNERETLFRAIFGETGDDSAEPQKGEGHTVPLFPLRPILPDLVERLKRLLTADGELELAATVDGLHVYDRYRCGADYCAKVITQPRSRARFPLDRRTISYWNSRANQTKIRLGLAIVRVRQLQSPHDCRGCR